MYDDSHVIKIYFYLLYLFLSTVYVSCLAWHDQDKDLAVGFSDGVVRVCSVQSDVGSVTVQAQQVSI